MGMGVPPDLGESKENWRDNVNLIRNFDTGMSEGKDRA